MSSMLRLSDKLLLDISLPRDGTPSQPGAYESGFPLSSRKQALQISLEACLDACHRYWNCCCLSTVAQGWPGRGGHPDAGWFCVPLLVYVATKATPTTMAMTKPLFETRKLATTGWWCWWCNRGWIFRDGVKPMTELLQRRGVRVKQAADWNNDRELMSRAVPLRWGLLFIAK
jgi:hypothetical protein